MNPAGELYLAFALGFNVATLLYSTERPGSRMVFSSKLSILLILGLTIVVWAMRP